MGVLIYLVGMMLKLQGISMIILTIISVIVLTIKTAKKAFKQLKDCKLIYEKKQGANKPNLIYVGKMELEYRKCGDYYIPNLVAPENIKNFKIGKYGNLRLRYLKEHKKAEYTILLMDNKLQKHLIVPSVETNILKTSLSSL